jgi:septal ring factor EnvC (AmiA/AmiB activator)
MSEAKPPDRPASAAVEQQRTEEISRLDRPQETIQRLQNELAATRRALAEAEQRLLELRDWRSTEIGRLERQVYWLERWNIDLDELMRRRPARLAFRTLRPMVRLRRRLFGPRRG